MKKTTQQQILDELKKLNNKADIFLMAKMKLPQEKVDKCEHLLDKNREYCIKCWGKVII